MGRAGSGGGSGHHFSGGHDMNIRSSGGHRMDAHRPGHGSTGDRGFSRYGSHRYGSYQSQPVLYTQMPGWLSVILFVLILLCVLFFGFVSQTNKIPKSTVNREALDNPDGFVNDCVIDEIGWIDNLNKTQKGLYDFYEKTGVQPFVYLKSYDAGLTTDSEKTKWAEDWYEKNIESEYAFLVVYFGEQDADNDVGFMAHVSGKQIGSVMDPESIDIFWAYWDENWFSDKSTDEVIVSSFLSTAKRIMTKSTTGLDVAHAGLLFGVVFVLIIGLVIIICLIHKRQREKTKEMQDILNMPIGKLDQDDLRDKYL